MDFLLEGWRFLATRKINRVFQALYLSLLRLCLIQPVLCDHANNRILLAIWAGVIFDG